MKLSLRTIFESQNCLLRRRNRIQFLATFLINILTFIHGLGVGWMSPVMRDLKTEDSPLSFSVVVEEISWIGSVLGIGNVIGNILVGLMQNRVGRKLVLHSIAIPHLCFWLLAYLAESVEYLYVGRLLAGIAGGGGYVVLPIFISEIADTNIRGTLGSMVMLSVTMGILAGYVISTYVAYHTAPLCIMVLPVLFFVCNFFFPDTPHHLIRKGKSAAALHSFCFYKNLDVNDSRALSEFDELKMKLTKDREMERRALSYKDFITRPAFRAYGTAFALLLANQFSGLFTFTSYMTDIFAASHTTLDENMCTITIGVVQLMGNYTATLLCDKYGRKILLFVSCLGCAVSLVAFGCFTYFADNPDYAAHLTSVDWLPLLLMALDVFLGGIGLVGCLFVVLVEVFPAKIRSQALSFFVVCLSVSVFVTLKIFPICMEQWGISVTMWSCSGVAFCGFLYFCCFLEETKGKSLLDS
ncbi:facilitated trehalose transporter Tret1-like [Scaptodrosophila lebanonensis]|uniref:Facilitated trehalose transporter Tret1-like n=1 Tax=Drosophila lebanonensis TaxID=7225 RepID=A0A6J2UG80_DROLE|nr:facilitated trehalose transporter Tret1-like [Scaptodrosophila lebanonensis]